MVSPGFAILAAAAIELSGEAALVPELPFMPVVAT
jgi:hypothetical protein